MLFLLRSAFCIGLVASALPDDGTARSVVAGMSLAEPATLVELCRADPGRCRTIAGALLTVEPAAASGSVRKLRDQLGAPRLPRSPQVL